MPVAWITDDTAAPGKPGASLHAEGAGPVCEAHLWPHRSLPLRGFVAFVSITCGLIAVPLLGLLGTPVLWGLLPFFIATVAGLWMAFKRSYADGSLTEEVRLWTDRIEILRRNPRGAPQSWEANPYWVRLSLRSEGGPVENYLTISGGGRNVELGAFLSPDERTDLHDRLSRALTRLR